MSFEEEFVLFLKRREIKTIRSMYGDESSHTVQACLRHAVWRLRLGPGVETPGYCRTVPPGPWTGDVPKPAAFEAASLMGRRPRGSCAADSDPALKRGAIVRRSLRDLRVADATENRSIHARCCGSLEHLALALRLVVADARGGKTKHNCRPTQFPIWEGKASVGRLIVARRFNAGYACRDRNASRRDA
jgi:hypothetical protein